MHYCENFKDDLESERDDEAVKREKIKTFISKMPVQATLPILHASDWSSKLQAEYPRYALFGSGSRMEGAQNCLTWAKGILELSGVNTQITTVKPKRLK